MFETWRAVINVACATKANMGGRISYDVLILITKTNISGKSSELSYYRIILYDIYIAVNILILPYV